jgi:hypothetical protein
MSLVYHILDFLDLTCVCIYKIAGICIVSHFFFSIPPFSASRDFSLTMQCFDVYCFRFFFSLLESILDRTVFSSLDLLLPSFLFGCCRNRTPDIAHIPWSLIVSVGTASSSWARPLPAHFGSRKNNRNEHCSECPSNLLYYGRMLLLTSFLSGMAFFNVEKG